MPDALETFMSLSPSSKAATCALGILAWAGGLWFLDLVRRAFR
jgi:hypothetical protein